MQLNQFNSRSHQIDKEARTKPFSRTFQHLVSTSSRSQSNSFEPSKPMMNPKPDPQWMFSFSPAGNGNLWVHSPFSDSVAISRHNPGVHAVSSPGQLPGLAFVPARFLHVCHYHSLRLNGFMIVHGPPKWSDGPVLLYSIYPLDSADYFGGHTLGYFSVMSYPRNMLEIDMRPHSALVDDGVRVYQTYRYRQNPNISFTQPSDINSEHTILTPRAPQHTNQLPSYYSRTSVQFATPTIRSRDSGRSQSNPPTTPTATSESTDVEDRLRHNEVLRQREEQQKHIEMARLLEGLKIKLRMDTTPILSHIIPDNTLDPSAADDTDSLRNKISRTSFDVQQESMDEGPINIDKTGSPAMAPLSFDRTLRSHSRQMKMDGSKPFDSSQLGRGRPRTQRPPGNWTHTPRATS